MGLGWSDNHWPGSFHHYLKTVKAYCDIPSFYVYTGLEVSQYSGLSSNKFANKYLQIESNWCNSSNKHHERIMFKMSSCKHLTHKSPL